MKRSAAISVGAMAPVTQRSRKDERKHDIPSCNEAKAALEAGRDLVAT
jgi:hypothetical protein